MSHQAIFQVLQASLINDEAIDIQNWKLLFSEMKAQAVATLPYNWLKKHSADGNSEWISYCVREQGKWIRLMYMQDQLLKLLEDNNIPCVIIKGTAAAMAYPHPHLRTMGDVDFLVKRSDFERAAFLLEGNGYM